MPVHYLYPLFAAFLFALSSIAYKKALAEGAGVMRSIFVTNMVFFVLFLPFWLLPANETAKGLLWAPLAAGVLGFLGWLFQVMALKVGDVSVATPLLGGKVMFVALLSTLVLGNVLPLSWWLGALLAGIGVFFLGHTSGTGKGPQRLGLTIFLTFLSVTSFAGLDIIFAGWGKAFGFERFVAVQQIASVLLSLCMVPFFNAPLRTMAGRCWPWIIIASLLMALQFYVFTRTIAVFGDPTVLNILYSSRGIFGVILVWTVGPLVGNRESGHGWGVFWKRITGAVLLFAAICLVMFEKSMAM